ncbi:sugar O-acetyltransferase, partial [Lactobacillus sp. XV13L]|nr:sugar O-acetyltransferase [Lactobacillus sp. XV13L]
MSKDYDYHQMLAGQLYCADFIRPEHNSINGKKIAQQINQLPIEQREKIITLERQLVGKAGQDIYINPPLYVDYGRHISLGDNFYANQNCTFLDVNQIVIGNNVLVGPNVSFYTAGHPLDAEVRRTG